MARTSLLLFGAAALFAVAWTSVLDLDVEDLFYLTGPGAVMFLADADLDDLLD